MTYAVPFVATDETFLTRMLVAKKESVGTEKTVVVHRHDNGDAGLTTGKQYCGRDKRIEVVDMDYIGLEYADGVAHHVDTRGTIDPTEESVNLAP